MNKYLKGCSIILGILLLGIISIIIWYNYDAAKRRQQAKIDAVKYSEICEQTEFVTGKPYVTLTGFDSLEVNKVRFLLIRQGMAVRDTLTSPHPEAIYESVSIQIPFAAFKKTDTIVMQVIGEHEYFFQVSDFHHYAYLHYGMMGYLGTYDCRFDDHRFLVNGKANNGQLRKKDGLATLDWKK
ncbi:hypothetical protein ODZ84_05650 [Chryseobacterium fluminis]|uniref:hypothetical protein n=1 Tax=Chryseobacterium fluminis TaxID=2983606 RepID=UPI0022581B85|nr:hypothetical protein [Chryseobacterium sp. MMS21-Ot14]UZT99054.1 hypothetical protein ODZ84_05650 [Chryseobacterium sp. MMS21-Ot14]